MGSWSSVIFQRLMSNTLFHLSISQIDRFFFLFFFFY